MHESTFTRSVNKKLPRTVYAWKVNARYAPGVPDCWYSGPHGDLWVEWKYLPKMPKTHKPKLSELQRNWLNTRYDEGRNVLVLVGSPQGIAIFEDRAWNDKQTIGQLYSRDEIATWMTNKLCVVKPSTTKEPLMTLELFNASTAQGEILSLLIKAKGQELVAHPEQSPLADAKYIDEPTLIDQGHVMHGTMVIALYLEQRYPSPCLLPQDPCKSSVVMMLFRNIIKTGRVGLDLPIYKMHLVTHGYMGGDRPSLVDVAVAALAPKDDPYWAAFLNRLEESWGSWADTNDTI